MKTLVKDLPPAGQTGWPHSSTHLLSSRHTSPPAKDTIPINLFALVQYKNDSQHLAPITEMISADRRLRNTERNTEIHLDILCLKYHEATF